MRERVYMSPTGGCSLSLFPPWGERKKDPARDGEVFLLGPFQPFLRQAAGAKRSSMGKISRRPKSMSRLRMIFDRSEKAA